MSLAVAPAVRRVRAYFAPVNRATGATTVFDPAQAGRFDLEGPPEPWIDLGWVDGFARKSGTKVVALQNGAPALASGQARTVVDAEVSLEFQSWGKLQMALAGGSQQMNLLKTASDVAANGSGGVAAAAVALLAGSTATALNVGVTAAGGFSAGDWVAVDVDYVAQTGYVGSGVSGAYVKAAADVASDANYIRRVTLNVAQVASVGAGVLQLSAALPCGVPTSGMKVAGLVGFVDREGGTFFQEWSALFVLQGEQGDRVVLHYPRLQAMTGAGEARGLLAAPLEQWKLAANFRALAVKDANDGERVVCFRSYLPAQG